VETYDVVIVGGGVIGASVAWHLASRGCTRVRVLDAAPAPGMGSTGKATGGFRVQFGSEPNVRLSLLAREKLRRFADEVGVDPGFRPCGYLFLTEHEETLAGLLEAQAMQRALGVDDARPVTVEEALGINPAFAAEGLVGGVYCPSDGFTRPLEILRGCLETTGSPPSMASAAWIRSAGHSEKPIYRALPLRTASESAAMVSSSGVSQS
jgi:sarcosine oxidase subunit beta